MADIIAFPIIGKHQPIRAIGSAEHLEEVVGALVESHGPYEAVSLLYLAALRQQALLAKKMKERGYAKVREDICGND